VDIYMWGSGATYTVLLTPKQQLTLPSSQGRIGGVAVAGRRRGYLPSLWSQWELEGSCLGARESQGRQQLRAVSGATRL
jgi:hypothetical protein